MGITTRLRSKVRDALKKLVCNDAKYDALMINQGRLLSELNKQKDSKRIADHEFKVFSQFGEDGIIQYLTSALEIKNKTFIEFGVEDFSESRARHTVQAVLQTWVRERY